MKRTRHAAVLVVSLLAVLPTAACYQGADNTVNTQPASGNATDFRVGDLLVQDTTLVAATNGSGRASLIFTVVNAGTTDDSITSISVGGTAATLRTAPLLLPAGASVKVGGDSPHQVLVTGLKTAAGSYAEVSMTFRNAGTTTQQVVVVPATGYYAGYGPAAALS